MCVGFPSFHYFCWSYRVFYFLYTTPERQIKIQAVTVLVRSCRLALTVRFKVVRTQRLRSSIDVFLDPGYDYKVRLELIVIRSLVDLCVCFLLCSAQLLRIN